MLYSDLFIRQIASRIKAKPISSSSLGTSSQISVADVQKAAVLAPIRQIIAPITQNSQSFITRG